MRRNPIGPAILLAFLVCACQAGGEGGAARTSATLSKHYVKVIRPEKGKEGRPYWSAERGGAARTGWLPLSPLRRAPTLLWEYKALEWSPLEPVEGPGFVAFGTGNSLFVLNAATGEYYYDYGFTGIFESSPTIGGERFFFGTAASTDVGKGTGIRDDTTFFYSLGIDSQNLVWKIQTPWVKTSPAVEGDLVVFNTFTLNAPQLPDARKNLETWDSFDSVHGVSAGAGGLLWNFPTVPALHSPAIRDGRVYVVSAETLYVLEAATGEPLYQVSDGMSILSHPVVGKKALYIATAPASGANLYALDPRSGKVIWKTLEAERIVGRTLTLALTPAGKDLLVYGVKSGEGREGLAALEADGGKRRWRKSVAKRLVSVAGARDTLYVGAILDDNQGCVMALNLADGAELWRIKGGKFEEPAVAVGDGVIYVKMGQHVRAYGEKKKTPSEP